MNVSGTPTTKKAYNIYTVLRIHIPRIRTRPSSARANTTRNKSRNYVHIGGVGARMRTRYRNDLIRHHVGSARARAFILHIIIHQSGKAHTRARIAPQAVQNTKKG